jgi:hypothetical protein
MSIHWVTIDKCKLYRPVNQYNLLLEAVSFLLCLKYLGLQAFETLEALETALNRKYSNPSSTAEVK